MSKRPLKEFPDWEKIRLELLRKGVFSEDQSRRIEEPGGDSLEVVELVMALEENFEIRP